MYGVWEIMTAHSLAQTQNKTTKLRPCNPFQVFTMATRLGAFSSVAAVSIHPHLAAAFDGFPAVVALSSSTTPTGIGGGMIASPSCFSVLNEHVYLSLLGPCVVCK
jgi:uncharacterized membrane protein